MMDEKRYVLPKPVTNGELYSHETGSYRLTSEEFAEDQFTRDVRVPLMAKAVKEVTGIDGWPENKILMSENQHTQVQKIVRAGLALEKTN
jgi:hypothetical protein